ncbi:MAG: HU family DNA-binding protein [Muribaculaceae bacterium]|nr:HU family DNA-binding protein [Muribaculaceae bacterium]
MNNIVNLSELITRVAKVTGTDTNTARRFLRGFFATIEDGLAEGESVSIKNIGTFRRNSDPLSGMSGAVVFIPDNAVSEEVNKPFSMFEPVELADGIEPAELDQAEEPQEEPAPEEPVHEPEPEETTLPEETSAPEEPARPYDVAAITEPETVEIRHEAAPEPTLAQSVTTEIPAAPIHTQPEPELETEPEPAEEEPAEEELTEESTPDEEPRRRSLLWLWIAIGLIAGGGLGYFFAMNDPSIPDIETIEESEPEIEPVALPEVAVDSIGIASAQTAAPDTAPAETPAAAPAPAVEEPKPQKEAVYDTVTSTRYLAKMAREYYGKSIYWVFIYDANSDKLGDPNKVSPGTRVLIPDKESLPGSNTAERDKIAERLSADIQKRFK